MTENIDWSAKIEEKLGGLIFRSGVVNLLNFSVCISEKQKEGIIRIGEEQCVLGVYLEAGGRYFLGFAHEYNPLERQLTLIGYDAEGSILYCYLSDAYEAKDVRWGFVSPSQ